MKTVVAFHIGKGGKFNNAGHKSFNPYISSLKECFGDAIVISEDENGNELPDEEWALLDSGGNIILHGREAIESEVGILEWDTIYDTDIVKYLEDCDDEELRIIYQYYITDSYPLDDDIVNAAVESQGMLRIESVKFYKDNALISTTDGVVSFFWDGYEDVTEDDFIEWAEQQRIDPLSARKYASDFEAHFYND